MGVVKYIDYNGQSVLFIDFEGAATDHDVLELGEKAVMLVKLGARKRQFLMYNLRDVRLTKTTLAALSRFMVHAPSVERRVLFGIDPSLKPTLDKLVVMLRLERNTVLCKDYTDALNTLTDDKKWAQERRHANAAVEVERRAPTRVYTEEDFLDFEGEGRLTQLDELDGKD